MGSVQSRTVEIEISNRTECITLKNPRTHFESGSCSKPPLPELGPGSSDSPQFQGSSPSSGISGILVYEAESFTLAIYFSNPIDSKFSLELGLELSMSKAHQGTLESTYARMAKGTYSSSCLDTKFERVTVGSTHGTALLSSSPIKVMATMSNATTSLLKVVLEEQW